MILFTYFLSFVSGLLTAFNPIYLLIFFGVFWLQRRSAKKILFFGAFALGLILIFISKSFSALPFTRGISLVIDSGANFIIVKTIFSKFYLSLPGHHYKVGDIIFLNGAKEPYFFPFLEGDFNYGQYLKDKGIAYALTNVSVKVLILSPLRLLESLKINVDYPAILSGLKAFLLFKNRDYKDLLLNTIAESNLLFMITLSGVHLSFIRRVVKKVCMIFFNHKTSERISYLSLLPLYILDVTKFAFYRIFVTGILRHINARYLKHHFNYLELNVIAASLFLFINPYLVLSPSFYLSYTLIFAFIITPLGGGFRGKIRGVFILWMVIIPYQLLTQSTFSLISLVLPLILTPLVSIWFLIYHITLVIIPMQRMGMNLLYLIYRILEFSTKIDLQLQMAALSIYVGVVLMGISFIFFYANLYGIKPLKTKSMLFFTAIILLNNMPLLNGIKYGVTFINVGQGDAILVNARGRYVLIDTGGLYGRDVSREILIPYFKKNRIYVIETLIITHDDFDHSGGVDSLDRGFRVRNKIMGSAFMPFTLNNITFYNLNPGGYDDINLNSLIIYITFPSFQILLMGDAGHPNETALISNYPDLIFEYVKIGHHGSNSSTSDHFIAHYMPQTAIISCGYNNRYGHPHPTVLNTLNHYGVAVRRTDIEGTIVIERW